LIGIGERLSSQQIHAIVRQGRGRMPAFPNISGEVAAALVGYLTHEGESGAYFTPCRPLVSPDVGHPFHVMSAGYFTHVGHPVGMSLA